MRLRDVMFIENVIMTSPVTVLLKGGFKDSGFNTRGAASTVIDGSLKIRRGTLRVEALKIR